MSELKAHDGLRSISRDGEAYRFMLGERDAAVLLLSEAIEDCNDAACALFGVSREAFIGRSPLEFAPPTQPDGSDSDAASRQRLASALAGLPQWCSWQYRRRDGTLIDTLVQIEAVRVDGARRVLVRIRDVSRLQRAEDALVRTEKLLQQILDNTSTAIVFAKDLANRYLFINRAFERIAGRPAAQVVGKTTHELLPGEVADALKRNDDHVIATRETILVEEQVRVGGETRTLLTNKFPLLDAHGEPYGMCGIAADITERKHTEEALRSAALAVSSAGGERVFEALVRSVASILDMEVAFIALRLPDNPERLRTLALYEDGALREQVEYGLPGTACADVVGKSFRLIEADVARHYPGDPDFRLKSIQSYAGAPLSDAAGASIGLMSVASRRPISSPSRVEAVLRIFAARAMAELERRRAEAAMRAGMAQYRAIFDASVDGMALLDDLGWIVDANPAFCAMFRYGREEILALDSKTLVPKESVSTCLQVLASADADTVSQGECLGRRRDGTLFDMELRGVAMVYQGRPHRLAIVRDITERKRAETERLELEASYRSIFEASEDGIYVHDWDSGAIIDVNPRVCEMTGYSREELLNRLPAMLGAGDATQAGKVTGEALDRARRGETVRIEFHRRSKDGSLHWDEVSLKSAVLAGKRRLLAIVREITERKAREEALRASEEQYRAVFDGSTDALVLWDAQLRRVDVNPAYLRLFGYTRDEVIGGEFANNLPAQYAERRRGLVRRTLGGESCHAELESMRKNGERIQVDVRTIPIQFRGAPHALAIVRDVTEHKRAEAAIRASEEQYRAIFNASEDALVLWDSSLRRVDVNPAYERIFGWSRDEVIGEAFRQRPLPPAYTERRLELVRRALAGEASTVEIESVRKNGERFHADLRNIPIRYRGEPHVLAIGRDVTARKRAAAALAASEEQYRAVFNASLDALVLRDEAFRIVDVNPSYERMSGYRRDEVLGADNVVANPPEVNARVKALHVRALEGETIRLETRMVRRDGSWLDIELSGVRTVYQGRPHVLYSGRDVTERARAVNALQASEEQYRAIFNAAADSMVLRDAEFRIVDVNPAYEAMSGRSRAEAIGRQEITMTSPDLHERIRQAHRQALGGNPVQWEADATRKNGETFYIETRGVPIQYKGQPHVLYVGRDITERKRAEIERAALEAQLRQAQKMEAIGQLTGGIAHDFNNILTGIMGYLVLAGERPAAFEDPRLARHLEQARLGAQRARDLIQQMLTFSRGRRGSATPVALGPLIAEATALLRSSLPATLELRTAMEKGLPQVRIDPVQFEQVLLNLCINARDAMEGSGTVRVHARIADASGQRCASCKQKLDGRFVEIAVEDEGHGIPPEVLERMFEPFFSTKDVGRGSGMGLASVHGIVHEHGGHIVVDTLPGRGTTFRIELPALEAP
ncbi:MAG: PAS domain S-box protein, partial [Burkholderiales bacterium]|nr:PAS domain S-box protein [Burkholderiales bacterium]